MKKYPDKCDKCGSTNLVEKQIGYLSPGVEEYIVVCADCGEVVAQYTYGDVRMA